MQRCNLMERNLSQSYAHCLDLINKITKLFIFQSCYDNIPVVVVEPGTGVGDPDVLLLALPVVDVLAPTTTCTVVPLTTGELTVIFC